MKYEFPFTKEQFNELQKKYQSTIFCGGGLDRGLAFSQHGDRTIWTVIGKYRAGETDRYIILDWRDIKFSLDTEIKNAILYAQQNFNLQNIVFEVYQSQDIFYWCSQKGIPAELSHAGENTQVPAFINLYQIISNKQIVIPSGLNLLISELKSFQQEMSSRGVPKFGHKPGSRFHDDTVYSLAWAIYSLREKGEVTEEKPFEQVVGNVSEMLEGFDGESESEEMIRGFLSGGESSSEDFERCRKKLDFF